mmetsp:Transcript_48500/g.134456  ORF Transcript_48500/g.134456 Transcript_48500/m.134456 type:complete len:435 (+) Transcript_48500:1342-2646(+)
MMMCPQTRICPPLPINRARVQTRRRQRIPSRQTMATRATRRPRVRAHAGRRTLSPMPAMDSRGGWPLVSTTRSRASISSRLVASSRRVCVWTWAGCRSGVLTRAAACSPSTTSTWLTSTLTLTTTSTPNGKRSRRPSSSCQRKPSSSRQRKMTDSQVFWRTSRWSTAQYMRLGRATRSDCGASDAARRRTRRSICAIRSCRPKAWRTPTWQRRSTAPSVLAASSRSQIRPTSAREGRSRSRSGFATVLRRASGRQRSRRLSVCVRQSRSAAHTNRCTPGTAPTCESERMPSSPPRMRRTAMSLSSCSSGIARSCRGVTSSTHSPSASSSGRSQGRPPLSCSAHSASTSVSSLRAPHAPPHGVPSAATWHVRCSVRRRVARRSACAPTPTRRSCRRWTPRLLRCTRSVARASRWRHSDRVQARERCSPSRPSTAT